MASRAAFSLASSVRASISFCFASSSSCCLVTLTA